MSAPHGEVPNAKHRRNTLGGEHCFAIPGSTGCPSQCATVPRISTKNHQYFSDLKLVDSIVQVPSFGERMAPAETETPVASFSNPQGTAKKPRRTAVQGAVRYVVDSGSGRHWSSGGNRNPTCSGVCETRLTGWQGSPPLTQRGLDPDFRAAHSVGKGSSAIAP